MTSCLKGFNRPPKELVECYICDPHTICYRKASILQIRFTRSFGYNSSLGNRTLLTGMMTPTEHLGISGDKIYSADSATIALSLVTGVLFLLLIGMVAYKIYQKIYNSRRRPSDEEAVLNNVFFQNHISESELSQQYSYEIPTLGDEWHLRKCIDSKGGNIPFVKYGVQLDIPSDALFENEKATIYLSVHTDMPAIMHTLKVDRERIIVAPVVECLMPGIIELNKYAKLTIPHCVRKHPSTIHVQWFDHDITNPRGLTPRDIVVLESFEDHEPSMDIFCVNANDGYLRIYTKHFSTIVCTQHGQIEFNLQASLYGQLGNIDEDPSVRLKLELGGPLMTLPGFWEDHHNNMEQTGFRTLERNLKIYLLPKQEEGSALQFRIGLIGEAHRTWTHVKREGTEELIHQVIQTTKLKEIFDCELGNHLIRCGIQWYLVGPYTNSRKNLPLFIDIVNIQNMDIHDSEGVKDRRETTINVEFSIRENSMEKIFDILSRKLSNGELKKIARFLDYMGDFPDIENRTDDEKMRFLVTDVDRNFNWKETKHLY